ncbi:MAG: DUF1192 domain-containing protein [Hyphomicrobiales bacterium]|nr:DUF1192 domain-containing protein [Hyphomicrobiales bacterium]
MDPEDLEPRPKPVHEIGENLSMLSVEELQARIELLKLEIARLETDMAAKQSSRAAADAVFKL